MDKVYNHQNYEKKIYSLWEKSGAFTPEINEKKKPFTIIMPPPNANDPLHIGHAREVATQDILIRYHRMRGESTLWLPGADHAGIETQFVFEKRLAKQGKKRSDFDRETLYKMIWDYVQANKHIMENQLKQLGASCDWTRNKFTLDPDIIKIVYKTFKKLFDDGLIYRGERIVNYCPRCGTAYSQLEVDYVERDDNLYYLDYSSLTIATTRPETIFADVAVAVNPKDERYKNLIGKDAILPIVKRNLPIIQDSLVDKDFATGALKITPGHDPTDFEIGQKHKLSVINVIDDKGKMINTPEKYIGMKAEQARLQVVEDLEKQGLVKKIEKIHHVVGTCYKDKGLIEPIISKQWFIKVGDLAKNSLLAIKEGKVKIVSPKYKKITIHWLKNLKDWNISRQIVWGIRIPAWRCGKCLEWTITEGQIPKECSSCKNIVLVQDEDTFDTWFSSGQWPFATLLSGSNLKLKAQSSKQKININTTQDFEYFYPTSVMDPAYDILPFWVIRMIMLGLYATGEVPFKQVLLHGLVRDKFGVKISKSKGNVIDPIEMVEKYGADALRMASIWGSLVENDNSLSEDNIRGQRNFSNKVWNVSRFVLMNKSQAQSSKHKTKSDKFRVRNDDDKWILAELKKTIHKVTKSLEKYRLNEAAEELYQFIWNKFASIYLEKSKSRKESAQPVLEHVLINSLKLLHPFMPFVTEAIWQEIKELRKYPDQLLISSSWPEL
ncbi:valine--tRNA ligase [Candidatus Woesebacteria bacterium RBG_16_34_12]|uniref:Valine--tRNA ligase n=1 Tax=Candidatus Woesebacteria bacterium RBG_16_34_12 TaxID=1802480 RepID=A0A1F7X930_9BACT|nr:MAG: valine--tRNA ligase [Candidatus Woesebacteria bacterium RBG_16_34_12]